MSLTQLPSGPETLIIEMDFPQTSPRVLFDYWTDSTLLQQWWPQQAELQPYLGGIYHFSWPQMNWHLRGRFTHFEPGKLLGFTWKWDHDPLTFTEKEVKVAFEQLADNGTRLYLTHGPYAQTPEDQALRLEQHLTGWQHFLPRLRQAVEIPD